MYLSKCKERAVLDKVILSRIVIIYKRCETEIGLIIVKVRGLRTDIYHSILESKPFKMNQKNLSLKQSLIVKK